MKMSMPHKDHNQDEIQTKSSDKNTGYSLNSSLNSDRLHAVFFLKMMLRNILEHHFLIGTSLLSAHLGDSSFDRISSYV